MSKISRFFVEKRPGLDYEAEALLKDIRESLAIGALEGLRLLHRYDIEGASPEHLADACDTVLSEPPVDKLYKESFPLEEDETFFVREYLPGQFDQCADSLAQCIQIISGKKDVSAAYGKVFVLKGALNEEEVRLISQYCHNPIDSRIGATKKPASLYPATTSPPDVENFELTHIDDERLEDIKREKGLAMSAADLAFCREYFREEEREPTVTEIKVIDTYWSDHCRHTTFLTELTDIKIEEGHLSEPIKAAYKAYLSERKRLYSDSARPVSLMDMALMGMKALKERGLLADLDQSDEINACSIEIDVDVAGQWEKWLLMFKNETHNHPTEIEPYGGAATCLGGAIRDPLSGRAYVYQAMRITGAGDPRTPASETLPGKLPQKKITTEAAHGYSSYGNQIGLATGHVREIYDEGFIAKRMEIGAVIGAAPKRNVLREKPKSGDVVIVVGGRTGRDGCGGATGSSKEHGEHSYKECGAEVQKGNPPTERKLQRLFRNKDAAKLIKKCNDFGAGGVCVAIGELSDSITIDLDSIPKKYEGLDGTELAISESQERMAVVVNKENADAFIAFAEEENLEAVIAAQITDDGFLRMFWRGREIVKLKRSFLDTNGATQSALAIIKPPRSIDALIGSEYNGNIAESFKNIMKDLNACSQKGLSERFDSTIGGGTVLMPFGGGRQLTPEDVMAAKLPVPGCETETVSVMSAAYDPEVSKESPFHGGMYAVVESVARLVAAGCEWKKIRLSFQEYFEKMTDEYSWGKPAAALIGAFAAQMGLSVPSIGGKDSMSGTFGDLNVPPVLASFGVGVTQAEMVNSAAASGGFKLYALLPEYDEYGIVNFDDLKKKYRWFHGFASETKIMSAAAVKRFGIAETVSKMCFGNGVGVEFCGEFLHKYGAEYLFKPIYGGIIFEVGIEDKAEVADFVVCIGETNSSGMITGESFEIAVDELLKEWEKPLESVFPTKTQKHENNTITPLAKYNANRHERPIRKEAGSLAKPRVFIPIFPGTNCEYDSENAFTRAGAKVETLVFKNTKESHINESLKKMEEHIRRAQIIMLPGGFSAGDEPNGSAKFIASVFRNKYIAEAVNEHIKNVGGLILGICNGFQALIKLGLLPYGEITEIADKSPTIYYNEIGRHISQIVDVKIISNKSPFLWGYNPGEVYKVPVSHGEGRFLVSAGEFERLIGNGQIASVYVDGKGNETLERPFNPNGSMYAVEGLLSPDGRIFGRMGHPERKSVNTFKNVEGEYDTEIFKSAVRYFG